MKHSRILVVEDDTTLANMYRASLRFAGFEVSTAADGLTALTSIEANPPDLIVLDLHLPRIHGAAVLQEVASQPKTKDIPVIVVTASDPTHAVNQATAILRKPCDPDLLLSAIEHSLRAA